MPHHHQIFTPPRPFPLHVGEEAANHPFRTVACPGKQWSPPELRNLVQTPFNLSIALFVSLSLSFFLSCPHYRKKISLAQDHSFTQHP